VYGCCGGAAVGLKNMSIRRGVDNSRIRMFFNQSRRLARDY